MTLRQALDAAARDYIVAVLTESRWSVTHAAAKAGVHRTHFYKLMEKHGVTVERSVKSCPAPSPPKGQT